jgi:transposase, IS6 family
MPTRPTHQTRAASGTGDAEIFIPANNAIEADHGRFKARLRPMRGLKTIRSLRTIAAGHAFVQNLRRGHYQFVHDHQPNDRVRIGFDVLATAV